MAFTEDPNVFFNTSDFAVDATYTPVVGSPSSVKVIVDAGVKVFPPDFDSAVVERRTEIQFAKAAVATVPRRGDQITVGAKTYKVDEVVGDDNFMLTVVVR